MQPPTGAATRKARGLAAYHSGLAAEDCVARAYERAGLAIADRRWRGQGGELDLIARDGEALVFIEVKRAKSADDAMARVSAKQRARLFQAAEEYLGTQPRGILTDSRFDLAFVDGYGRHEVIENAFL